jgi:hypothetical protein
MKALFDSNRMPILIILSDIQGPQAFGDEGLSIDSHIKILKYNSWFLP